jgi:hypothetical protein
VAWEVTDGDRGDLALRLEGSILQSRKVAGLHALTGFSSVLSEKANAAFQNPEWS